MLEAIGKELKIIRIRNNLTLEKAASKLNISRETLRRYENNASGLSVEKLENILDYYKVNKVIFFEQISANMHTEEK